MNKQEWLEIKRTDNIPISVWYDFFIEKGGQDVGLSAFQQAFNYMAQNPYLSTHGKIVNLDTAKKKLHQHYDDKFSVND